MVLLLQQGLVQKRDVILERKSARKNLLGHQELKQNRNVCFLADLAKKRYVNYGKERERIGHGFET